MNQKIHTGHKSSGRRRVLLGLTGLVLLASLPFAFTGAAQAGIGDTGILADGTQRTTYTVGPINVTSGQNRISYKPITGSEKPSVDGWITRIEPNMTEADGTVPKSSRAMFHHGVWINQSAPAGSQLFFATGEEKTNVDFPDGYGLRYRASDTWILNHMIHNLVPDPMTLYITYTIDFIPDTSPAAAAIVPVRPIWMDVQSGNYPVFDVHRGSGGKDGQFTYPQDAENPYQGQWQKNEKIITSDGVLITTAGHVHSGGLSTDLYLHRNGASYAGPTCAASKKLKQPIARLKSKLAKLRRKPARSKPLRRKLNRLRAKATKNRKAYKRCRASQPNVNGNRVHLFESRAKYFDPNGPVSWDMAMYNTDENWRVAVEAGDKLELQTTYETKRASWYESMGINVVYMAEEEGGVDPFATRVDYRGELNHGAYPENNDHGGSGPVVGPDPQNLPDGLASGGPFVIGGFTYGAGDFRLPGSLGRPPVVSKGQSFTFEMSPGDVSNEIWHSLTSCKSPCNKSTGISYPLPDGDFQFDSGQLGTGGAPTVNRTTWTTPANLPVGTHTFFCRIHPLMRGAFRVKP